MSTKFKETSSTSANIGQTLGDSQMIHNFLRKQSEENPQRKRNAEEICDKTNKKVFTGRDEKKGFWEGKVISKNQTRMVSDSSPKQ